MGMTNATSNFCKKMNKTKWIGVLLPLILVPLLLLFVDLEKALQIYSRISWNALILSVMVYFVSICLRALRFNWLINNGTYHKISIHQLLPVVLVHQFYNRILPFRAGEASYVFLLKTIYSYDVSASISSLLLARIYDALAVMMIFLLSLFFFAGEYAFYESIIIALSLLLVLSLLLWKLKALIRFMGRIFCAVTEKLYQNTGKMPKWVLQVETAMRNIEVEISCFSTFKSIFWLILSSLGIWIGVFAMFYLFMCACQVVPFSTASFWQVVVGATVSIYTFVLPINVISGPMEASWAMGFVMVGVGQSAALASGFGINWLAHAATALFAVPAMMWISIKKQPGAKDTDT